MKLVINKKSIISVFTSMLILMIIISPIVRLALGFGLYVLVFGVMIGLAIVLFLKNFYLEYKVLFPATLLFLMIVFVFVVNPDNSDGLFYSIMSLISFLLAYWLARQDKIIVKRSSFFALLIFYLFFISSMIKFGYLPRDVNSYFFETSRNYVSAAALFLQLMYSGSYFRVNRELPKITPVITFLIAILAYGRSGIALSAALLLVTLLFTLWNSKLVYKIFFFFLVLILVFGVAQYAVFVEEFVYSETNFKSGFETPRWLMIKEYLASLDFLKVFLGQDLSKIPIISKYDDNPHNSLIYGHSLYGFFYLILMSWFLISIIWHCVIYKHTMVYVALLSVFMIRIILDKLALPGLFDYIFYYLVFVLLLDSAGLRYSKLVFRWKKAGQ